MSNEYRVDQDGNVFVLHCDEGDPLCMWESHNHHYRATHLGEAQQALRDAETEYVRLFGPTDRFDKGRKNLVKQTPQRNVERTG